MKRFFQAFSLLAALIGLVLPVCWAKPEKLGLIPHETDSLKGRIPVILVHGINPVKEELYSWETFLRHAETQPGVKDRFKFYLFAFNPRQSVAQNSRFLQQELQAFAKAQSDAAPFRFVGLSLGGLLIRNALYDPFLWERTDAVIAVGVPFHGSPLASPLWFRAYLKNRPFLDLLRRNHALAYGFTRRKFPHFEADYCWDNFDGAMSDDLARRQICMVPTSPHRPEEDQRKYVTYAAFFGVKAETRTWLSGYLDPGLDARTDRIRRNPFSRHVMFRMVQPALAALPLAETLSGEVPALLAFNDGISPISSQLWLGRIVRRTRDGKAVSQEQLWQAVSDLRGSDRARLFEGLDHRDWLEGKTRFNSADATLPDWLHPNEPRRSIFDWILSDLSR